MFLYVTTQVSYVVIRHVLLLKIPRDVSERVKSVSRPFVCRCLRHTSVCERKKLWSRPDQSETKAPLEAAECRKLERRETQSVSEIIISDLNHEESSRLSHPIRICSIWLWLFRRSMRKEASLFLRSESRIMHADKRAMFARLRFVFFYVTTTQTI